MAKEAKRDKRYGVLGYSGFSGLTGYGTAYTAPVVATAPVLDQTIGINQHIHTHSVERVRSLKTFCIESISRNTIFVLNRNFHHFSPTKI